MKLDKLAESKEKHTQLEQIIYESLSSANSDKEFCAMTCDFLINAMNMSKRKPEETAVAFNTMFDQKPEVFSQVVSFAYYISALEFWNKMTKESNPSGELQEVVRNVEEEVERCKDIQFYYFLKLFELDAYEQQIQTFCENFNISQNFQKEFRQLVVQYQGEVIQHLLIQLSK